MKRRYVLYLLRFSILIAALTIPICLGNCDGPPEKKPNFIIIFTDDQGYNDLGCFGSPQIKTPNLDQMAREGIRFTSFYAQTVCGPSRAALMTGCYPLRVAKRNNQVDIHPFLHTKEITIAEILRNVGYSTACFGKWDLAGHSQEDYDKDLLPTRQGFDYFFGTPTSNDAVVNLLLNETIIEREADMNILSRRYTDSAIAFIQRNIENPFFLYIPHTMPHLQLGASDQFQGKSERGLYGDVIEEIDWNVGRLLDAVKELKLDEKTYIIFASDNGPWFLDRHPRLAKYRDNGGSHGGSALPLRGAKTSTWEGGLRVPCIMRAPGKIPAGTVCNEIASTLDILPTLCKLAGGELPVDRVIDGHDISDLVHGTKDATSGTRPYLYYQHTHLQAIRSGKWKLHLPRPAEPLWTPGWAVFSDTMDVVDITSPLLYDLDNDIGEENNVAKRHPDVVNELFKLAEQARNDIGDYDRIGKNARFFDSQPARPDIQKWKDHDKNE